MAKRLSIPKNRIIKSPGKYFLTHDLIVDDLSPALIVESDSVCLDLCGYKLISKKPDSLSEAIRINTYNDITIRNGVIENFYNGILATSVNEFMIENILLTNISNMSICFSHVKNAKIVNNKILDMNFWSTTKNSDDYYYIGTSLVSCSTILIQNNIISSSKVATISNPKQEIVGILLSSGNKNIKITHNIIELDSLRKKTIGIWSGENSEIYILDNKISNFFQGITSVNCNAEIQNNYINVHSLKNYSIGLWLGENSETNILNNIILNFWFGLACVGTKAQLNNNLIKINDSCTFCYATTEKIESPSRIIPIPTALLIEKNSENSITQEENHIINYLYEIIHFKRNHLNIHHYFNGRYYLDVKCENSHGSSFMVLNES